jgi:hypothetical protein
MYCQNNIFFYKRNQTCTYCTYSLEIAASTSIFGCIRNTITSHFITTTTSATSTTIIMITYLPSILLFLASDCGIVALYCCYRRGQRRMVADEAHERELMRQQALDASDAEQNRKVTKENLAHLLVAGVSTIVAMYS